MASMIAKLWTRLCTKRVPLSIMIVGLDNSGKTSILNYLASQNLETQTSGNIQQHQLSLSSPNTNNTHSSPATSGAPSATLATRTDESCVGGNIMPTFGYNYERIQYKNVTITVLDFSGQNRYRNLWQEFYNSVDGLVFVIDSSDLIRLVVVRDELETMLCHPYFLSLNTTGQLKEIPSYPMASEAVQKQITISQGKLIQSPLDGAATLATNNKTNKGNMTTAATASKTLAANQSHSRRRTKIPILFLANKTDLASSADTDDISKALNLSQLPLERHPWFIQATSVKLGQGIVEGFDWLVSQLSVN